MCERKRTLSVRQFHVGEVIEDNPINLRDKLRMPASRGQSGIQLLEVVTPLVNVRIVEKSAEANDVNDI